MTVEKIYHVETQEDYDALMKELANKGYKWSSGMEPTQKDHWFREKNETCVYVGSDTYLKFSQKIFYQNDESYKHIPIETYKDPQVEVNPMPKTEQEAYKVLANVFPDTAQGIATKLRTLYSNGGKIDTPKKVTVHSFVGDWIEKNKDKTDLIYEFLYKHGLGHVPCKLSSWFVDNKKTFYRAILDGYEVEKEKLYTVELPERVGLVRNLDNEVYLTGQYRKYVGTSKHLTEKEITDVDPIFMHWAKEVTE